VTRRNPQSTSADKIVREKEHGDGVVEGLCGVLVSIIEAPQLRQEKDET
jgi:hypothetical protein